MLREIALHSHSEDGDPHNVLWEYNPDTSLHHVHYLHSVETPITEEAARWFGLFVMQAAETVGSFDDEPIEE